MPATLDVSCPKCGKQLKVPAELEGKRVKCKGCQEIIAIAAPKKASAKAAPAKPAKAAPAPEPKPEEKKSPFLDEEDEGDGPAKPMGVIQEEDVPRCPHCADELDPPDAVVCIHCGFNNKTRIKSEMKKVVAANTTEWTTHLLPGIIAAAIAIAVIAGDFICYLNMNDWMAGSFLEKEEKNAVTGAVEYWVRPGAFVMGICALSIFIIIPAAGFAWIRLVREVKPEEKVKK